MIGRAVALFFAVLLSVAWHANPTCASHSLVASSRIEATVFYGRRSSVQILECYLRRNLKKNGGVLEKVNFFVKTAVPEDLQFLDRMLATEPEYYTKRLLNATVRGWAQHYVDLDDETYYFKIDDDHLYIGEGALEAMLRMAQVHGKACLLWSANVINHTLLTYLHMINGATMMFDREQANSTTWVPKHGQPISQLSVVRTAAYPEPFNNCTLWSWECAALEHYSLLERLHRQHLSAYYFNMLDFHATKYTRWSINMILFQGRDFNKGKVLNADDEHDISLAIPRSRGMHACVVLGHALAAHYSYGPQRAGLDANTDIKRRYHGVAEGTCGRLVPTS